MRLIVCHTSGKKLMQRRHVQQEVHNSTDFHYILLNNRIEIQQNIQFLLFVVPSFHYLQKHVLFCLDSLTSIITKTAI
jgi:hypothetical protein